MVHAEAIKRVLPALVSTPANVSDFISEGIAIIASVEYPQFWPDLTKELMSLLTNDDHGRNFRIWNLVEEITNKYPHEERSDPLYHEINVTLDAIHDKLLYYSQGYLSQIGVIEDKQLLPSYLNIYRSILRIFYNINSQDLPACVEDSIANWSKILKETLAKKVDIRALSNEREVDVLWFECKGEAIKSALLFATRYREEFMDCIQPFAQEIWGICTESSQDEKYDKILVNAMKYFKCFCENPNFLQFFSENLTTMFTKVLIPNLTPNEQTKISFEEEVDVFIENIFGNKESGDRAETCISFIRSLSRFHNENVENTLKIIIGEYIQNKGNGPASLANEIVCINLLCFAPVTGSRQDYGVVGLNMHKELIYSSYEALVKPRLAPIFDFLSKNSVKSSHPGSFQDRPKHFRPNRDLLPPQIHKPVPKLHPGGRTARYRSVLLLSSEDKSPCAAEGLSHPPHAAPVSPPVQHRGPYERPDRRVFLLLEVLPEPSKGDWFDWGQSAVQPLQRVPPDRTDPAEPLRVHLPTDSPRPHRPPLPRKNLQGPRRLNQELRRSSRRDVQAHLQADRQRVHLRRNQVYV